MFQRFKASGKHHTSIQLRAPVNQFDRDSFFFFLASDACDREKLSCVIQNMQLISSGKDVEQVFLLVDVLNCLLESREEWDDTIPHFLGYCVTMSDNVRNYVLDGLLTFDFTETVSGAFLRHVLDVLAACCRGSMRPEQVTQIIKLALELPGDLLVEKLVMLRNASKNLSKLPPKNALRMSNIVNVIVSGFVTNAEPPIDASLAAVICSIAKKVSGRIGAYHAGFQREIWVPFLSQFNLEYELIKICQIPVIIQEVEELPYKVKEELNCA